MYHIYLLIDWHLSSLIFSNSGVVVLDFGDVLLLGLGATIGLVKGEVV